MQPTTIASRIRHCAARGPERPFLTLLSPTAAPIELTYGALIAKAEAWRRSYHAAGLPPGARIVVTLEHSVDLYAAFIGALLGGYVPSYFSHPSAKQSREDYFHTIDALLNVAEAEALVTYPGLRDQLADLSTAVPTLKAVLTACDEAAAAFDAPAANGADTAFLQFSSGTTGLKKGVAISHQALLWQVERYADAIALDGDDRIVSWLPLYHDMGLIACLFLPLLTATPMVAMSPFDWARKPAMLLDAITRHRGTLCWLPNFAYNFMASKIPDADLEGIDLESLRGLVNCSEPILSASHDAFLSRFAAHGLRPDALAASYALAENTFAVTSGGCGRPLVVDEVNAAALAQGTARNGAGQRLVSSGRALPDTEIRIVGDDGQDLPERRVGEITVASPCLFSGYLGDTAETARALTGGTLATGDLGYLADGELFVVGRAKDLIIHAGKNLYPQDIEALVNGVDGVIPGRCVAFGVPDEALGTEALVVVAETHAEDTAARQNIRQAIFARIAAAMDTSPADVRLVAHMWLRKSTSGKISRGINRERYLAIRADDKRAPGPASDPDLPVLDRVRQCLRDVIADRPIEIADDTPLIAGGIVDSLSYVNIVLAVEQELGVTFPRAVLQRPERYDSIARIAEAVLAAEGKAKEEPNEAAPPGARNAEWEKALAVKYALAPQFRDVEAQPYEWVAYLMRRGQADYRSGSLNTDRLGFRRTYDRVGAIDYDRYMEAEGPRGIVAGNSMAYGAGTSADDKTFASQLNAKREAGETRWYNFALRASTLTQERIATELYAPLDAQAFVWVSGINTLVALLVGEGDPANPAPFIGETNFAKTMMPGHLPRPHDSDLEARYAKALDMVERDLQLLAAQRRAAGCRVLFCLQPSLTWIDKTLTPQEQALVAIFDAPGLAIQRAHHPSQLGPWRERYGQDLESLCTRHGIDFLDLNQEPRFAGPEWLFLDRTHLSDLGHEVVAEAVRGWL